MGKGGLCLLWGVSSYHTERSREFTSSDPVKCFEELSLYIECMRPFCRLGGSKSDPDASIRDIVVEPFIDCLECMILPLLPFRILRVNCFPRWLLEALSAVFGRGAASVPIASTAAVPANCTQV